jgi:3-keto-disaccharide hydrolase
MRGMTPGVWLRSILVIVLASPAAAGSSGRLQEPAFVPLFNGRDLSGWFNINCAPDTWAVKDGMIYSTGQPICELRTERMYENFVLELEYQHLKAGGNAGVFVWADALPARGQPFLRAIEVQVLDGRNTDNYTSHGDVFAIHGARMTPDRPHPSGWMRSLPRERRAKPAGAWNHYRITCRDGTVTLAVNGIEVSGGNDIAPRKGYIALESEGSPVLFRNLRIAELPAAKALEPEQIATPDEGFRSLYNGQDLTGWRPESGRADAWTPKDWILTYRADSRTGSTGLVSQEQYGDFMLIVDWRFPKTASPVATVDDTRPSRRDHSRLTVAPQVSENAPAGEWNRSVFTVRGGTITHSVNGVPIADRAQPNLPPVGHIALEPGSSVEFANLFAKRLR